VRDSRQGLALIVFHISDRVYDVLVSPQISLTSAVSPRTIFTFPTTCFSQFSGCIRFERCKYFFGLALSRHNGMHVVGSCVHCPQIQLRILQVSRIPASTACLCFEFNLTGGFFSLERLRFRRCRLGGSIGLPYLLCRRSIEPRLSPWSQVPRPRKVMR